MHIVLFLLFGLLVGALARLIVPGANRGGWLTSMAIGVLGAFVGGFLARLLGWYGEGQLAGFLTSLIGAFGFVMAYRTFGDRLRST
jgi:uncharacterized membrane protein YeaQ/YmgE (transglycosylase-associated protein family)